jgi:hypothetical protein
VTSKGEPSDGHSGLGAAFTELGRAV